MNDVRYMNTRPIFTYHAPFVDTSMPRWSSPYLCTNSYMHSGGTHFGNQGGVNYYRPQQMPQIVHYLQALNTSFLSPPFMMPVMSFMLQSYKNDVHNMFQYMNGGYGLQNYNISNSYPVISKSVRNEYKGAYVNWVKSNTPFIGAQLKKDLKNFNNIVDENEKNLALIRIDAICNRAREIIQKYNPKENNSKKDYFEYKMAWEILDDKYIYDYRGLVFSKPDKAIKHMEERLLAYNKENDKIKKKSIGREIVVVKQYFDSILEGKVIPKNPSEYSVACGFLRMHTQDLYKKMMMKDPYLALEKFFGVLDDYKKIENDHLHYISKIKMRAIDDYVQAELNDRRIDRNSLQFEALCAIHNFQIENKDKYEYMNFINSIKNKPHIFEEEYHKVLHECSSNIDEKVREDALFKKDFLEGNVIYILQNSANENSEEYKMALRILNLKEADDNESKEGSIRI